MDVTSQTDEQLKAIAYEQIKDRDLAQRNIDIIETELRKRTVEAERVAAKLAENPPEPKTDES